MELSIHNVVEITAGPAVLLPGCGTFVREIHIDSKGPLGHAHRTTAHVFADSPERLAVVDEQPEAVPA